MIMIYDLMNKGEANLKLQDTELLTAMSRATEKFEDEVLGLKPSRQPDSLSGVIELFMYENKISQAKLAMNSGLENPSFPKY